MDSAVAEKVCTIRERVADRIGVNRFRTWFGDSTEFRLHSERLDVTVPSAFAGSWIAANYMTELTEAAREVVGADLRVDVHVATSLRQVERVVPLTPDAGERDSSARPRTGAARTPRLRGDLESFVVGPCNQLAYTAAVNLVHTPEHAFRPLVIHGGCGLGKTHLIQGICNSVRRVQPALVWRYISGEEFTNEFVFAVKAGRIDQFRARFRNVDLLVIDDIHFLANKKATQEEFLHTFNSIDAAGKSVVMVSDRHPRDIATLSDPLINRLISGMVVEVQPPDIETRREILRRRALKMNCRLSAEVTDFIARHVTRNVRELEGALYKLVAVASLTKEPITLALARASLEDYIKPSQSVPVAVQIERAVSEYFDVTPQQMRSRARDRTISLARGVAMFLTRRHTSLSFPEIGRLMGNKNHSTVLMATRRIERSLENGNPITWNTSSGTREETLRDLLAKIEQKVEQRRH